jgi:mono/diheme cytochrome c family protein
MRGIVGPVGSCIATLLFVAGCAKAPTSSAGAELFAANCASCHGRYGEGDGPAAAEASSAIPDLRYLAARNRGEFPLAWVTEVIDGREIVKAHGDRLMPVWGNAFAQIDGANGAAEARTTAKIQALVDYLRTIQQK